MKSKFAILTFIFIALSGYSLTVKPNGHSDRYTDLLNPGQTFSGAGVLKNSSLTDTFVNPAVQAFQQRFALDISYAGIVGKTSENPKNGYPGHGFTLGAGFPSSIGYFTLTGGYFHSSWNDFALGDQGFFNLTLGKKVFDEVYLGLGLKTVLGAFKGNPVDYLVAADFGAVHKPGEVGSVKDFQWGIALQNIGWGTLTPFSKGQNNKDLLAPDLFSLQAGLSFSCVEVEGFNLGFETEIFAPSMMNFEVAAGFTFEFDKMFVLSLSSRVNALQLHEKDFSSLLPSFGILYRYIPKTSDASKVEDLTEAHVKASAGAMKDLHLWSYQGGATVFFGGEDTFAPEIQFQIEEENPETASFFNNVEEEAAVIGFQEFQTTPQFKKEAPATRLLIAKGGKKETQLKKTISPKTPSNTIPQEPPFVENPKISHYVSPNFDGIQDSLKISFDIKDLRLIKKYRWVIQNSNKEIVRVIENKEQREENRGREFFRNLFKPYKGIHVPSELIWDCTSQSGEVVNDGVYSFYISAQDENDNISYSPRVYFVVDTVYPTVEFIYDPDDLIFSPNQDGNKDFLSIGQKSSEEVLWKTQIENSFIGGVDSKNYKGFLPSQLVWGGKNQSGVLVPDGTYRYRVECIDKAGNKTEMFLDGIVLNTEQTPIQLFVDGTSLSPLSESGTSFLTFTPDLKVKDDILEWRLQIVNAQDEVVKEMKGEGVMEGVLFDGLNENGEPYPDGVYTARLDVTYRNGNRPQSVTPQFSIDSKAPVATAHIEDPIFSPDQDEQKDYLTIQQSGSKEDYWKGEVIDQEGNVVLEETWYNNLPETFVFDGYDEEDQLLPDGNYSYRLSSVDDAGNAGESQLVDFTIDTRKSAVSLKTSYSAFSPNGDGIKDSVELIPEIENWGEIESYELSVIDKDNQVVRSFPNSDYLSPRILFDGKDNEGKVLPDENYRFRLDVVFNNGQSVTEFSRPILLKSRLPEAQLSYDSLWFSPNGDGVGDVLALKQTSTSEALWTATIKNEEGKVVRTFKDTGALKDFQWDGKDEQGNLLADGVYSYHLETTDEAGNSFQTEIKNINLDCSPTLISVATSSKGFSPNGDGRLDTLQIKPTVSNQKGIRDWKMTITDGAHVKTYQGEGATIPETIVWNGQTDDKEIHEGIFHLNFQVNYFKGNQPVARLENLVVDITAPVLNVNLSPIPFSPDNDNVNDELFIQIAFDDTSDIQKWQFSIFDPRKNPFKKFEGRGKKVDVIRWDGRSYKGDTVFSAEDYPYHFMAADEWGNLSELKGSIPIDILVIRDGDRLKIQLANINFAPNSPSLLSGNPTLVEKNKTILERLTQTLKKYRTYQVQVEGHANAVLWYNEALAKEEEVKDLYPLSLARAQTIVNELVQRGIEENRLTAVGKGGQQPIVNPHDNLAVWKKENWKNRRVEFILQK